MAEEADWLMSDATCALTGIREGDVLLGKYRIEWLLGLGGMGAVFAATHLQLEARVALKVLLPEALQVPEAVLRFEQEARAAARIQSDHVVRVTDVGQLPDHAPYLVMEHLEGADLSGVLEDQGPLSPDLVVSYLAQACEGIAEAHRQGVIHRDLKPSNLFLSQRRDGSALIKVLDFGISKLSRHESSGVRPTSKLRAIGTPIYMSPEQVKATDEIDERADLWSLGIIAYELLVGRPPFESKDVIELCHLVVDAPVVPPRAHRPEIPAALEAVVLKCLEKEPARRYQSAPELQLALTRALAPPARPRFTPQQLAQAVTVGALGCWLALRFTPAEPAQHASTAPVVVPVKSAAAALVPAPVVSTVASVAASVRAAAPLSPRAAPERRPARKKLTPAQLLHDRK